MKLPFVAVALCFIALTGCAQAVRGDADQVYVDTSFALTDAQSIDEATKHCEQYGKIALYRGDYSEKTKTFACIKPSEQANSNIGSSTTASSLSILRKSADIGDVDAMLKLGMLYSGLQSSGASPDYPQSMYWLHRAADQGSSNAIAVIGAAYIKGQIGVAADPAEAMRWLRRAANLGNAPSMALVGMMFYQGTGVSMDKAEAARWLRKSADLGVPDAMKQLGEMYEKGIGVPVDKAEAQRWYQKAAAQRSQ